MHGIELTVLYPDRVRPVRMVCRSELRWEHAHHPWEAGLCVGRRDKNSRESPLYSFFTFSPLFVHLIYHAYMTYFLLEQWMENIQWYAWELEILQALNLPHICWQPDTFIDNACRLKTSSIIAWSMQNPMSSFLRMLQKYQSACIVNHRSDSPLPSPDLRSLTARFMQTRTHSELWAWSKIASRSGKSSRERTWRACNESPHSKIELTTAMDIKFWIQTYGSGWRSQVLQVLRLWKDGSKSPG